MLFKTEMENILPYTKQTKFDVAAASTLAKEDETNNTESWWDKLKKAGQQAENETSDWRDTADSWLQKGRDVWNNLFGN